MKTAFLLLFFLAVSRHLLAQDNNKKYYSAGLQAYYGFIIPHSAAIKEVSYSKPAGIGLDISRISTSYDSWRIFNTYWFSGIQGSFFNFRNREIIGSAFLLTTFAEPVVLNRHNHLFTIGGGAGFSYHTKLFDEEKNPLNKFFSTHISFPIFLNASMRYRLNNNTYLRLSGTYNHISNGGIKQPNYGMNFPTFSIGIMYFPQSIPDFTSGYIPEISDRRAKFYFLFQLLSSYRVLDKTDNYPEKGVFATGFHFRVARQLKSFYALNAGTELINDMGIREILRREDRGIDHKRMALTLGQDFIIGKSVISQHLGIYVYAPYKARHLIYQKYELMFHINSNLIMGVWLKAHTYVAELMGIGVSYEFGGR